jgi:hypothetical protein
MRYSVQSDSPKFQPYLTNIPLNALPLNELFHIVSLPSWRLQDIYPPSTDVILA